MKTALLAFLLAPGLAGAASSKTASRELSDLKGGRYSVKVSGLLCSACVRAIVAEVSQLREVDDVKADFDRSELLVRVKPDRVVTLSALRRALNKAAKKVNLDAHYEVESVRYKPL